jgi:arsenical pump membrane protein
MVLDWIIAAIVLASVALRPRSWAAAVLAAAVAVIADSSELGAALRAVGPTAALLSVALSVSALAVRLGFAHWGAARLAARANGSARRLFVLVCAVTALLTAVVTLDGAVVVMAPVMIELRRRFGAPLRPLVLGTVAVANAFSLALPEGNPTNLVVIERLGLSLSREARTMLVPGLLATLLCAVAVAWRERRALDSRLHDGSTPPASSPAAPGLLGVARLAVQILALLTALLPLGQPALGAAGLPQLLAVAVVVTGLAAVANNLPASAIVAAGLAGGPAAYAALVGLSVGALAVPRGSVATAIAGELTGERPHSRVFAPAALAAALASTIVVWLIVVS